MRVDLHEQRDAVIEVAIAKIWKFGVGNSVVPGRMSEGRNRRQAQGEGRGPR